MAAAHSMKECGRISFNSDHNMLPQRNPQGTHTPVLLSQTTEITVSGAERAMACAQAEADSNRWDVTICICDAGGTPIRVHRCNAFAASYDIAVGKARTAALFSKKTSAFESLVNVTQGKSRASLLSTKFVLMQGGVPIMVNGKCCGAVGVSGVKPEQDEQVARAAVDAFMMPQSKL